MWLLLFFLAGGFLEPEPEIYRPLGNSVAVWGDSGSLFVLDSAMNRIHIYAANGKLIRTIGGKGEGPGQFFQASGLSMQNGMLVVSDRFQTHFFDQQGHFIRRGRHPGDVHSVQKMKTGWLAFKGGPYVKQWELVRFAADDFSGRSLLTRWEVTPAKLDKKFNPVSDRNLIEVDSKGARALIKPENQSFFWLYDLSTNRLEMFETGMVGKPFDKDLGDMVLRFMNRDKSGWTADFPERFPPIFDMTFTATGKIAVQQWFAFNKGPFQQQKIAEAGLLRFYKSNGERVQPDVTDIYLRMIVSVDDQWVYYSKKDPEDESFTIARVEKAKAASVLAEESRRQFCHECLSY
ncbi:MAG: 6-bladed beta-propeller [Acidobacteriota bacterium]|nr:6-bladed beta-propeller [Acidobacteriota bacterium]